MAKVYTALVHYPVRDRQGEMITSAITNLDVHDIARSARTYGLLGYYVISPITAQRIIVDRILDHWEHGAGKRRVPERSRALSLVRAVLSIDEALSDIQAREGQAARVIVTEARPEMANKKTTYAALREELRVDARPSLIVFGTAHGLHKQVLDKADLVLEPIQPFADFNHLSVRAAAAITFDRLFSN